ncbi:MAG: spermidine/putrescine ABC transporter substrate-binding protein [Clostridiales bacterium]|nr:spermidine/putrescine ABC transporter substrate-binding protein [Clostridiales bacterium]
MKRIKTRRISAILVLAFVIIFLAACGNNKSKEESLNLMTWGGDFIPREIITEFEEETGIKVNLKEVTSNEDMQSLLEANPDQYDLAVLTDYMVDILRKNETIGVLDKDKIPNFSNINPVYQSKYYDENNEYSIPYAISTSLLLVNPSAVEELGADPIKGYGDLWQEELEDKVVIVDWSIEVIGVVLKALGYEYNESDPDILAEAREKLFELAPNIVRFETNTPEDSLINGEAVAGFMYSNQVVKGLAADENLEAVFPVEGMPIFIDSFVMSKEAPNSDNAYKFLDFVLRPEVAAKIADITNFTTANNAADEYLPEDYKNNPVLNIPDEVAANTSFYIDVASVLEDYDYIYSEFKNK